MIHTKITETTILGKKINKVVTTVHNYDLSTDKCVLGFTLRYVDPNRDSPAIPDTIQLSDTWDVPTEVVNAWSGSNTFLADKLCEHLGFTPLAHGATDMELNY